MCPVCCWQLKLQWVIHIPELMHATYSMYRQLSTHSHSYSATCAMEASLCLGGPRIRNVNCQVPSEFTSKKVPSERQKLARTALVFFRILLSQRWLSLHNRHSTVALRLVCDVHVDVSYSHLCQVRCCSPKAWAVYFWLLNWSDAQNTKARIVLLLERKAKTLESFTALCKNVCLPCFLFFSFPFFWNV